MPTNVSNEYFLRQFDRMPEGEPRLKAMAAHCALLFNSLKKEEEAHLETKRRFVERLAEVSPIAALMREACDDLNEAESDR